MGVLAHLVPIFGFARRHQAGDAGIGVLQALRDELALEGFPHPERREFIEDAEVQDTIGGRQLDAGNLRRRGNVSGNRDFRKDVQQP